MIFRPGLYPSGTEQQAQFIFSYIHPGEKFIMDRKKPDVDVVSDVLKLTLAAYPDSSFIQSLSHQYIERGGLSKKQLEGLYKKAADVKTIPASKLSTIEAIILKKPTRYKSALPAPGPLYTKDARAGELITAILEKYPQHKRVLFLKTKYDNNEVLSSTEMGELEKFYKLLM
jgi:hypothetical protein